MMSQISALHDYPFELISATLYRRVLCLLAVRQYAADSCLACCRLGLLQNSLAGLALTPQHSRSTACALLSDDGYLLIQAFFQALQPYSWGFALIQSLSEQLGRTGCLLVRAKHAVYSQIVL